MRKIILASHGSMAEGVLSAAKMIMGDCEEIQALGLDRYESPAEIARRIERQVAAEPDCDFMIFCDIHGGSFGGGGGGGFTGGGFGGTSGSGW